VVKGDKPSGWWY